MSDTEVAATFYTTLETAKLHSVNPAADLAAAVNPAGDLAAVVMAAARGVALMRWAFAAATRPATTQ